MRHRTKARAAIERRVMPERQAFIAETMSCAACGSEWRKSFPAVLDVHEVIRGGARAKMIQDRRAWLVVCRLHNSEMHDLTKWPVVVQFALKLKQDAAWFDLAWLNSQRGAGVGFSLEEVVEATP